MKVVDRVISVNIILRYYHNHVAAGTMLVNCPMQLHNRRKSHMHTFAYLIQRDHLPPLLSTSTANPRHLYLQTAAATLRARSFTIDKCALWHITRWGRSSADTGLGNRPLLAPLLLLLHLIRILIILHDFTRTF